MNTKQTVIFQVATAKFLLELQNDILFVKRAADGQMLDQFHVDEDPLDMVVDEIVMDFIEWCPVSIDTDDEVLALTNEVYATTFMFYALRELQTPKVTK